MLSQWHISGKMNYAEKGYSKQCTTHKTTRYLALLLPASRVVVYGVLGQLSQYLRAFIRLYIDPDSASHFG